MNRKEVEIILGLARPFGARTLDAAHRIIESNSELPITESQAWLHKNVGKKTISELKKIGLVTDNCHGLPRRIHNFLSRMGIDNKDQARSAITEGRLHTGLSGYKESSHTRVMKWIGFTP